MQVSLSILQDQINQSSKIALINFQKRQNHSSKTSPIKVQMDNRPNKLNAYNRSSFNSTRHNFSRSDKIKPELDDDAVSLTEEDNIKLDEFIESAMPKVKQLFVH